MRFSAMPRSLTWALVAGALKDSGEAIAFQNVHMTSYSGRTLSLSTRTVNETAAVLETLNGS
jgi:hypothetical protein